MGAFPRTAFIFLSEEGAPAKERPALGEFRIKIRKKGGGGGQSWSLFVIFTCSSILFDDREGGIV